ncbi:MAG TPA: PepSY-like domain-containing protein [Phycisphaerae bacterium]|nr:PepSY-like domain-containing protein [Phycisphaerae bacterium]
MRMNKTLVGLVGMGALAGIVVAAWASAPADEQEVTLEQVPAAVKATILKESAGGKIAEIERETKNGQTIYEVEILVNGKEVELRIAEDGTLLGKEIEDAETHPQTGARKQQEKEYEREVTEAEVPPAALAALKKLAAGAKITEFAEEIEHGSTFYEGSWKTAAGSNVDALVTSAGDLVEIEEQVAPDQVPAAILAAVRKLSGQDAPLFCEKKTMILYEVKFRKGDRRHELLLTPDGRRVEEEIERGKGDKDDDEDDDEDDHDDDDNDDDD